MTDQPLGAPGGSPQPDPELEYLVEEIKRTREELRQALEVRGSHPALISARVASLAAIDDFAAVLERRSLPLPRQLQSDRTLLRALCVPLMPPVYRRER